MTTIVLDPPCALISANDRLHYHKRADLTRAWREAAYGWAMSNLTGHYHRAYITVAIRFPTNHRRDVGNYHPTAKAIVDGLVDAGVIPDDDDQHVTGPDLRRERPNGPVRVTVRIRELPIGEAA